MEDYACLGDMFRNCFYWLEGGVWGGVGGGGRWFTTLHLLLSVDMNRFLLC